MRTKLLLIISLLSTLSVLSQSIGDYRTKGAGPVAWNNANSWQVYNGTTWEDAIDYPGQNEGNYDVEIASDHTITLPSSTGFNVFMPYQFGTLTINGQLYLSPNQNVYVNASATVVTENEGSIYFQGNADLRFPANMPISVFPYGLLPPDGNCNASKRVYIGTILFSTCNGNGPGDPISFLELMEANGSLISVINATFADCNAAAFTADLLPSYVGLAGTNTSFSWIVTEPDLNEVTSTANPFSVDLNKEGVYQFRLTYVTYYNNTSYTHTRVVEYDNKLTTWDGDWTNGIPDLNTRVVIAEDYSAGSFSSCFLKINNGATLTINPDNYVEVAGSIDNQGAIIVESEGSLVQNDDASSFSGNNITVKRTTRPMRRSDYVYWGSPVQENVLTQIPTVFDKKFRWQAGASYNWFDLTTTTPTPGNGFITRVRNIAPYNTTATPITFTFSGKPNNGEVTVPVSFVNAETTNYGNYNLIANPYPSGIDAEAFIIANTDVLSGTIYFWTSLSAYTLATQYTAMDYASWNLSGASTPPSSDPENEDLNPRGTIASAQGMFVQAKANGTVTFSNTMREIDNNDQFFRTENSAERSQAINIERQKNRLWLLLSNNNGVFRNMMVGYIEGATNNFEDTFDGVSFTSNPIDFYSVLNDKNLVIQGRALPFNNSDVITLGYKTTQAGQYTIQINGVDGFFSKGFPVYIHDKTTNTYHNIRSASYSFTTAAGTFNNRFELVFDNEDTTYGKNEMSQNEVLVYGADQSIYVTSKEIKIKAIEVYDILGKQLFLNTMVDANEFVTPIHTTTTSFLIVKTTLENNTTSTKKIIFQ
ncbi:T9SS sorting signal type C domain-containing protein [Flavobacterium orientale]|uniref:T9SS sorting signal type C domain-containing protein n=1 Tax=Flavobacterium orientale TaxID=1756020 RepID=A0A916XXB2_9FLAO|nr:T9SS sorting signal type C domain-containing protein [Flavobacterium orientale]GGD18462.1 hypothetical protein GCM10011343_06370 [Flavobacterium orientale]